MLPTGQRHHRFGLDLLKLAVFTDTLRLVTRPLDLLA